MKRIFLVTGHNPKKQGYNSPFGTEHYLCSLISTYITTYYNNPDFKLMQVPTGSLKQKVDFINSRSFPDDYTLEIHLNAFNKRVQGTECLCNKNNPKSVNLSRKITSSLTQKLNLKNRGVKPGIYHTGKPLYLINRTKYTNTILIECFFVDSVDVLPDLELVGKTIADCLNGLK